MSDITQLIEKLSPEKLARFQALLLKQAVSPSPFPAIPRRTGDGTCPVSVGQQRLWFFDQMRPGSATYNIAEGWRMRGNLDEKALERSLSQIVARHEALRTRFEMRAGELLQVVCPVVPVELAVCDLRGLREEERQREVEKIRREEATRPFHLEVGPMARFGLVKLTESDYLLLVTLHHIVSDGWSFGIFWRELSELYHSYLQGEEPRLPMLSIQYGDFAQWQRQWLQGEVLEDQLHYWKEQLSGAPEVLDLPTDQARPATPSYHGAVEKVHFSEALTRELMRLSQREGVTLFMTLLAGLQTLLHRYSGQEEILVGTPVANRNQVELEPLIGFFVNMLVLRSSFAGNPTFRELLQRVSATALAAYAHQDVPFERLLEELRPARHLGYHPFFQVAFAYGTEEDLKLPGLTVQAEPAHTGTAKFDLTLSLTLKPEGLRGTLEYNTDLFERQTIQRLVGHFENLLTALVANPSERVGCVKLMSPAEEQELVVTWNQTEVKYPRDRCIHELFEEQVAHAPEAIAVVCEGQSLSYAELNRQANEVARQLIDLEVGPEVLVGLCVERSIEMVVGLLGILKAGGAYVPLDPGYPQARLLSILSDAKLPVILVQGHLVEKLPTGIARMVLLPLPNDLTDQKIAGNPTAMTNSENLAYVMYTSGSTGEPKGVAVIHRAVVRLVKNQNYASFTSKEVFLQMAPLSFDASTLEIWGPLLNGGKLVVLPPSLSSLSDIGTAIRQDQVTTLWLTSALFHVMVDEHLHELEGITQLLTGGDVISLAHFERARQRLKGCRLIAGYGPTENTTFTCCFTATEDLGRYKTVPLGRPVSNTQVYILDPHLNPTPIGVAGELYAGGDGLAREYLGQPELTAEKFVPNPFAPQLGSRLYKTGDLARYLPDGNIEFLERKDQQVKIRGFRIELGEVEAALAKYEAVRQVAVVVREDIPNDKRLVAYVAAKGDERQLSEKLGNFIRERLPEYMVPSAFVFLPELPRTANGKLDRRALPSPTAGKESNDRSATRPKNSIERELARIWCEVLRLDTVSTSDNFFALGGHSLTATQVVSRINERWPATLTLRALFENPTVTALTSALSQLRIEQAAAQDLARHLAELGELSDTEAAAQLAENNRSNP